MKLASPTRSFWVVACDPSVSARRSIRDSQGLQADFAANRSLFLSPTVQAIPVDEPISRLVGTSRDVDSVWRIPEYRFQHALTLLPSLEEMAGRAGGAGDPAEAMAG